MGKVYVVKAVWLVRGVQREKAFKNTVRLGNFIRVYARHKNCPKNYADIYKNDKQHKQKVIVCKAHIRARGKGKQIRFVCKAAVSFPRAADCLNVRAAGLVYHVPGGAVYNGVSAAQCGAAENLVKKAAVKHDNTKDLVPDRKIYNFAVKRVYKPIICGILRVVGRNYPRKFVAVEQKHPIVVFCKAVVTRIADKLGIVKIKFAKLRKGVATLKN